jgi:autotransporter-associated beta strand protein
VAFNSANTTLTLTGNNNIDAGGILVTPTAMETIITGGSLHSGGGNGMVVMNYGSLNVASAIVDNAPGATLTISGPGITTLSGANTYTGATCINNGSTLQVGIGGSGASIGSTSGVTDNGSLIFNHADTVTLNQIVSGNGSLTMSGTGTILLSGNSTYTGGTTVDSGTLIVTNSDAFPNGTSLTVGAGGTFIFDPSAAAAPAAGAVAAAVPEPSTLTLLGVVAVGLLGYTWRRRRSLQPARMDCFRYPETRA